MAEAIYGRPVSARNTARPTLAGPPIPHPDLVVHPLINPDVQVALLAAVDETGDACLGDLANVIPAHPQPISAVLALVDAGPRHRPRLPSSTPPAASGGSAPRATDSHPDRRSLTARRVSRRVPTRRALHASGPRRTTRVLITLPVHIDAPAAQPRRCGRSRMPVLLR